MKRSGNLLNSGIGYQYYELLVELLTENFCNLKICASFYLPVTFIEQKLQSQHDLQAPSKSLVIQILFHLSIVSNALHIFCKQHEPMACLGLLDLFQNMHNTFFIQSLLKKNKVCYRLTVIYSFVFTTIVTKVIRMIFAGS